MPIINLGTREFLHQQQTIRYLRNNHLPITIYRFNSPICPRKPKKDKYITKGIGLINAIILLIQARLQHDKLDGKLIGIQE